VGTVAAGLDITQGALAQDLRILRDAALVAAEKRGYYMHYRINEKTSQEWREVLEELLSLPTPDSQRGKPCAGRKDAAAKSRKS